MILTDEQIIELIKHPAHEEIIGRGRSICRESIRHVKGIGVEDFFIENEVKGYENEEEKLLRHKISRATTVPIFASALGTFDKAFSASGYSCYFEIDGEDKDKTKSTQLKAYLNDDIGDGLNMSQLMQQVWGDKIHYDPNGVLMVELPKLEEEESPEGKQNKPYVIFKSIYDIHDYDADGMKTEYLILKTDCHEEEYEKQNKDNSVTYFRVIDSDRDLIVRVEKGVGAKGEQAYESITILDTEEYPIIPNVWKYVPAIVISGQRDARSEAHQTFIWEAIGTADDYLLDSSIANVSKKKHGFPQRWGYAIPCKICEGKGRFPIYGEYQEGTGREITGHYPCKSCTNGSLTLSPSIATIKPLPDLQNPDIGEPFGYVTPDISSMEFQITELARLEKTIHESIWTVIDAQQTSAVQDKTATASVLDVSAKQTKLNKFSSNGEKVEQFLTYTIGKAIYKEAFKSSIVKWGRRYYVLSLNELEASFKAAKEAGANSSILLAYLEDMVYVKWSTDPVELARQLKLLQVEPFAHMTVKEVQDLKYAATSDKFLKTYFNDYIEQINRTKPEIILVGTVDELMAELKILNDAKMNEAKAQEPPKDPLIVNQNSKVIPQ